mgnify:CR=1 FL=1
MDVAYSAEQALEMPLTSYQLILLDVMMGKMSGFKFAQILQSDPATAGIPIIFCTAKDCEDDMVAGSTSVLTIISPSRTAYATCWHV